MSSGACSVRTWKRSSAGTLIVSTSARWMASPTLRRYDSGLPLTSEMRTSGMACEEVLDGLHDQPIHRFGPLAARLVVDARVEARIVQQVFVGVTHGNVLSGKRHGGVAATGVDQRDAALAQAIAGARLEHDVARLVLFGDPHRALDRAYRAARAVDDPQGLVLS